jgi:hypothetical protein
MNRFAIVGLSLLAFTPCLSAQNPEGGQINATLGQAITLPKSTITQMRGLQPTVELRVDEIPRAFNFVPDEISLQSIETLNTYKQPMLAELNQTRSKYSIYQVETDGKLTLLQSAISRRHRNYVATSDFMQYAERTVNGVPKKIGYRIRMRAEIRSLTNGVDLNGLFRIGIAAKESKINGSLAIEVHGLAGPAISNHVGSPFSLSEESLVKAIESAAILRSKVSDDSVFFIPVELGD